MRPKITHVAIRYKDVIYKLPCPNRHHHVIALIVKLTGTKYIDPDDDDQGFIDEQGNYLTRQQALVSALCNNQVLNKNNIRAEQLFSEDLW